MRVFDCTFFSSEDDGDIELVVKIKEKDSVEKPSRRVSDDRPVNEVTREQNKIKLFFSGPLQIKTSKILLFFFLPLFLEIDTTIFKNDTSEPLCIAFTWIC